MALNNLYINHVGKPPKFDGNAYGYWKKKMQAHIKSMNRKIWQVVEKDFIVLDVNDPTPREDELLQLNDIAVNVLYEALEEKIFEHVKDKERAYEIWTHLEETYEGTNVVKGAKLYILRGKWKSFKMDEDETVPEMFTG